MFFSLKNNTVDYNFDSKNKLIITPYLQKAFNDYQQSIFMKKIAINLPKYKINKRDLNVKEKKNLLMN